MMRDSGGLLPVILIGSGTLLLWSAVKGRNPLDMLKSVLSTGNVPATTAAQTTPAATPTNSTQATFVASHGGSDPQMPPVSV